MYNKYIKHAKISEGKFRELIKYFSLDLDGLQIAELSGLNRNTVGRYLNLLRQRIAAHCEGELPPRKNIDTLNDDENLIEFDDHFVANEGIIFGLFRGNSKIHTEMVDESYSLKFRDIVRGKTPWEAMDYSINYWYEFDGLVELGKNKYFRLNQTKKGVNGYTTHINGIKSFWSFAQMRLLKFRGVAKHTFYLHLKECEFRFNNRSENLYGKIMDLVKREPL